MDVKRETGLVALKAAEEFGLSVTQAEELQKVDVEEFARVQAGRTRRVERVPVPEAGVCVGRAGGAVQPQMRRWSAIIAREHGAAAGRRR